MPEQHECPNCKQRSITCGFGDGRPQTVKCSRCRMKVTVTWRFQEMAPEHEEHATYRATVKKAKR